MCYNSRLCVTIVDYVGFLGVSIIDYVSEMLG